MTACLGLVPTKETLTKPSSNKDHAFYSLPLWHIWLLTTTIQSCSQTGLCFLLRLLWKLCQKPPLRICLFTRQSWCTVLELRGKNCRRYSELLLLRRDSSEQVSRWQHWVNAHSGGAGGQSRDRWDSQSASICTSWNRMTNSRSSRVRANDIGLSELVQEMPPWLFFWNIDGILFHVLLVWLFEETVYLSP